MSERKSLEKFVEEQLQKGAFNSREELVQEALSQMQQRQQEVNRLAQHMRKAAEEIRRGDPGIPFNPEEIIKEAKSRQTAETDEKSAA